MIGRSVNADLAFDEDMSISRHHAYLEVESTSSGEKIVTVQDAGSRYGTSINGTKMEANGKLSLKNIRHLIRFGANQGTIVVQPMNLRFCFSQLDKSEKELLKMLCSRINSQLATTADVASHLVTKTLTATVKSLTAVVLAIPIISMDWVRAIPASLPTFYRFPDEAQFRPPLGPKVDLQDVTLSRRALFSNIKVLLVHGADAQYSNILEKCGASITSLYPFAETSWAGRVKQLLDQSDNEICVFFDESRGAEYPSDIGPFFTSLSPRFHWLTARALATSVLTATAPHILVSFPIQWNRFSVGASQSQLMAQSHMQSTLHASAVSAMDNDECSIAAGQPLNIASKVTTVSGVKRPFEAMEKSKKPSVVMENKEADLFFSESVGMVPKRNEIEDQGKMKPPPAKKMKKTSNEVDEWDNGSKSGYNTRRTLRPNLSTSTTGNNSLLNRGLGSPSVTSATSNRGHLRPIPELEESSNLSSISGSKAIDSHKLLQDIGSVASVPPPPAAFMHGDKDDQSCASSEQPTTTVAAATSVNSSGALMTRKRGMEANGSNQTLDVVGTVPIGNGDVIAAEADGGTTARQNKRARRDAPADEVPPAEMQSAVARGRGRPRKQPVATDKSSDIAPPTKLHDVTVEETEEYGPPIASSMKADKNALSNPVDKTSDIAPPTKLDANILPNPVEKSWDITPPTKSSSFAPPTKSSNIVPPTKLDAIVEEANKMKARMNTLSNPVDKSSDIAPPTKWGDAIVAKAEENEPPIASKMKAEKNVLSNSSSSAVEGIENWLSVDHSSQLHIATAHKPAEMTRSFSVRIKVESKDPQIDTVRAEEFVKSEMTRGRVEEDDEERVFIVAETIERELLLVCPRSHESRSSAQTSSSSSSSLEPPSSSSNSLRDVRKFRKNSVRRADDQAIISSRHMQRVLPKETEREIQMRLELEQLAREEAAAQELFLERMIGNAALAIVRRR
jgi:hypothetical protein